MKKYRGWMPVIMIVLMAVSWYMLVADSMEVESAYGAYLSEARKFAENGITKYAMENYNKALEIKSSAEVYKEVADYYKSQEKDREYVAWCKDFLKEYPREAAAYDCTLDAYMANRDYESCYDVLEMANKRGISSGYINQVREEIRYVFHMDFNTYEDVGVYSNNYCGVFSDYWGFVDRYGNQRVSCSYKQAGSFTQSGFAPVVNMEGRAYFIDKTGSKVLVPKEGYESFGPLVEGKIAAQKTDGTYTYVDEELQPLFGSYDYASTFNNGIAAVKKGEQWQLIDEEGVPVSSVVYTDIKLDEKEIAFRNGRAFVAVVDGSYIMVDNNGTQVGSLTFEDARVFAGAAPAAVKMDGRWQFVDDACKSISDKKYNDAKSFANEMAAVCVNGKWGFVDSEENLVIEPQFFDARDFNEKGSCFVKTGDKWQLLKLYRLNREE